MLPTPTPADLDAALARIVPLGPLRVAVFGSFACGTARPGADLDLLVTFEHVPDKRQARRRVLALLRDLPVAVDVVVTTPEEIDRRGWIVGSVLYEALREGRAVYEASPVPA